MGLGGGGWISQTTFCLVPKLLLGGQGQKYRRFSRKAGALPEKGFPSRSLGTSHSWASGPPKTMKLAAKAFHPVPGHPRAGVLHFQSRNCALRGDTQVPPYENFPLSANRYNLIAGSILIVSPLEAPLHNQLTKFSPKGYIPGKFWWDKKRQGREFSPG
jgi:hypothetical protein